MKKIWLITIFSFVLLEIIAVLGALSLTTSRAFHSNISMWLTDRSAPWWDNRPLFYAFLILSAGIALLLARNYKASTKIAFTLIAVGVIFATASVVLQINNY